MQKTKIDNYNNTLKTLILCLFILAVAIVAFSSTVSAAYVDTSYDGYYTIEHTGTSTDGAYTTYYTFSYVFHTDSGNGGVNTPYNNLQTAYSSSSSLEIASGNTAFNNVNITGTNSATFSHWSGSTSSLNTNTYSGVYATQTNDSTNPNPTWISYHHGGFGAVTTLNDVTVYNTASGLNTFLGNGGSGSNLAINKFVVNSGNGGTQNLNGVKINDNITVNSGNQYFNNDVYVDTATSIFNGGDQYYSSGTTTFNGGTQTFNGGDPHFNAPVIYNNVQQTVLPGQNTDPITFNNNVNYTGTSTFTNNAGMDSTITFYQTNYNGDFTYTGNTGATFKECLIGSNFHYTATAGSSSFINNTFTNGFDLPTAVTLYFYDNKHLYNGTTPVNPVAVSISGSGTIIMHGDEFHGNPNGWTNAIYNGATGKMNLSSILISAISNAAGTAVGIINEGFMNITNGSYQYQRDHTIITGNNIAIRNTGGNLNIFNKTEISYNGHSAASESPIQLNGGTVNIYGSTYIHDNSRNGDGGAIYQNGATLTISDTRFVNNRANGTGNGGAIYQNSGSITYGSGNRFTSNYAAVDGGAIYIANSITQTQDFNNGNFTLNHANGRGGAVYAGAGTSVINSGNFTNNTADAFGGAIYADASTVTVGGSYGFTDNSAPNGGAIYHFGTTAFTINGRYFNSNKATSGNGGGIYTRAPTVIVNGGSYNSNGANQKGGAIFTEDSAGTLTLNGPTMSYNYASTDDGGAVYHSGSGQLMVNGGLYQFNTANAAGKNGGGIWSNAEYAYVRNDATFNNNTANTDGGAIYLENSNGLLQVDDSHFNGNRVGHDGGAIYQKSTSTTKSMYIGYSDFTGNSAGNNGGAIWTAIHHSTINATSFYYNVAYMNGGGLYLNVLTDATLDIFDSSFTSNIAQMEHGGGIYQVATDGYTNITRSTFHLNIGNLTGGAITTNVNHVLSNDSYYSQNTARNEVGGAIYQNNNAIDSWLNMTDGSYLNNYANQSGGVIYSKAETVTLLRGHYGHNSVGTGNGGALYHDNIIPTASLNVTDSTFEFNTADHGVGGAIYGNAPNGSIHNATFRNNNTAIEGGAIYYDGLDLLNVTNSSFLNNSAQEKGGAIYSNLTQAIVIEDSIFNGNTAVSIDGGAIYYNKNTGVLNISGSDFNNNTALNGNGGGIWSNVTENNIDTTNFNGNGAVNGGGVFYLGTGTLNITDSDFVLNYARIDGGGIWTTTDDFFLTTCTFDRNSAGVHGGAIYYPAGKYLNITDIRFWNNTAGNAGGAIYTNASEININNTEFIGNVAGDFGGAIYYYQRGGVLNINDTRFIDNAAVTGSGGAIFTYNKDISVNGSIFNGNRAGLHGGAIEQISTVGNFIINGSSFSGNVAGDLGGAVKTDSGNFTITESSFNNNRAGFGGGAVYHQSRVAGSNLTMDLVNFTGNSAGWTGGALEAGASSTSIGRANFVGNTAAGYGGAIYHYGTLVVGATNFTSNSANRGGAVYSHGHVDMNDVSFHGNTAVVDGGGIYHDGDYMSINNGYFDGNVAGGYGAGIYEHSNQFYTGYLQVHNSVFVNNRGTGAVASRGESYIYGSYFGSNDIGAVDFGSMAIGNSTLEFNKLGLWMAGDCGLVYSNTIVNNTLGIQVTGNNTTVSYNRIVGPRPYSMNLINYGVNLYANYNWWGINDAHLVVAGIELNNWFVMYVNTSQNHFVNPGDVFTYLYYFGLNTQGDFNVNYLPVFFTHLDENGTKSDIHGMYSFWKMLRVHNYDMIYVTSVLDHQLISTNINDYSTRVIVGDNVTGKRGDVVLLTATLLDAYGAPMLNQEVEFFIDGVFVGSSYSDINGVANVWYTVNRAGKLIFSAQFKGGWYDPIWYVSAYSRGSGFYRGSSNSTHYIFAS